MFGVLAMLPAAPSTASDAPCVAVASVRCAAWTARYDHAPGHAGSGVDETQATAASRTGVFVVGGSEGGAGRLEFAAVAYDVTTGALRWSGRHAGTGTGHSAALAVGVDADGARVFVSGVVDADARPAAGVSTGDMLTVAYDAATGDVVWSATLTGAGAQVPAALAADSDGSTVYVTGSDAGDYATVAYDARTGQQRWLARFDGGGRDEAAAIAAASGRVFVTGRSAGAADADLVTVAYEADAGQELWVAREAAPGEAVPAGLAASANGSRVVLAGTSEMVTAPDGRVTRGQLTTLSYGAASGARQLRKDFGGGAVVARAGGLALSPDGNRAYVVGMHRHVPAAPAPDAGPLARPYATALAYDLRNGSQLWLWEALTSVGDDDAVAVVVPSDHLDVVVAGPVLEPGGGTSLAVTGLNPGSGAARWSASYRGWPPGENMPDDAVHLAAVPGSARVVAATTLLVGEGNAADYLTLAFDR